MKKSISLLLVLTVISWVICYAYVSSPVHFGWLGTSLASVAGILATISAYQTEETTFTQGCGVIHKSESPIRFLLSHIFIGLFLTAIALIGVMGCLGYASGS
jgi:hypothetical protein